jgi:hypothetical protein
MMLRHCAADNVPAGFAADAGTAFLTTGFGIGTTRGGGNRASMSDPGWSRWRSSFAQTFEIFWPVAFSLNSSPIRSHAAMNPPFCRVAATSFARTSSDLLIIFTVETVPFLFKAAAFLGEGVARIRRIFCSHSLAVGLYQRVNTFVV